MTHHGYQKITVNRKQRLRVKEGFRKIRVNLDEL